MYANHRRAARRKIAETRSGCGQLIITLNIAAFMPAAEFAARREQLIAQLKSTPLASGAAEIFTLANSKHAMRSGMGAKASCCPNRQSSISTRSPTNSMLRKRIAANAVLKPGMQVESQCAASL